MPTDNEQVPPPRKTIGTMLRITLGLAVVLLVVGLIVFRYNFYDPTRWTYRYHQRELTAIVARIKAQSIPIDTRRGFEVAHSLDPTTLAPYKEADYDSVCKIDVYRRDQDDYLISITIDEEGHFGTFGLLYSDLPPKTVRIPDSDGFSIEGALGSQSLKERLSAKWSYVFEGG